MAAIAAAVVPFMTACRSGPAPVASRIVGPLRTTGGRIVDARGRAVRFVGVGITDLAPGQGRPASKMPVRCLGWQRPPAQAIRNVVSWGFNTVRLSVTWSNIEPTPPTTGPDGTLVHHYDQPYLAAVDDTVRALTSRGIAVILELSQNVWSPAFARSPTGPCRGWGMPAWLYAGSSNPTIAAAKGAFFDDQGGVQERFADIWRLLAGRYRRNRLVVAADMMNEPYVASNATRPADLHLDRLYRLLGPAIRGADPDLLLLFQDTQFAAYSKTGQFGVTAPPPFPGVVYETHLYTRVWEPDGLDRLRVYERRASAWGVPLFVGEFNAFGYGNNSGPVPTNWMPQAQGFEAYCRAHAIGWLFQAYDGGTSLTVPGTQDPKPGLLPALQRGF